MSETKNNTKQINDGFTNIIKGMGALKDPRNYSTYRSTNIINRQIIEELYSTNWLSWKAIDVPVEDAIQNWRTLSIDDPEKKKLLEEEMKSLSLKDTVERGLKWGRAFGGAGIIPIIEGEDLSTPLDISKIRQGSLKSLVVLDRYNLTSVSVNYDVLLNKYNEPEFYTVIRGGQLIHTSRVIKFYGEKTTIHQSEKTQGWGLSLFSRLYEPILDALGIKDSIANLVLESNVDVYMIKNFGKLLEEGKDEAVLNRLRIGDVSKSTVNGIALDADDSYDKKTNNFASLPELDDRFLYKVAGAIPMPFTKLAGREPSGLNATGEADQKIYNKSLTSIQNNDTRPVLDILDQIIYTSTFGVNEQFNYIFNPLDQATAAEKADINLKQSQIDMAYLDSGVIDELDVKMQLAENGTYVSITPDSIKKDIDETENLFPEE